MLFIDTCYLLSLINVKAKNHEKALNRLKKKRYVKYRNTIIDLLYGMDNIHYLTTDDYNNALDTCKQYGFSINYSDCTILETMRQFNVINIVSFDSDFDKTDEIRRIYL